MEVGRHADAKLLLPHVSVTAFMNDSTFKASPPVSRVTGDANLPAYSHHIYLVSNKGLPVHSVGKDILLLQTDPFWNVLSTCCYVRVLWRRDVRGWLGFPFPLQLLERIFHFHFRTHFEQFISQQPSVRIGYSVLPTRYDGNWKRSDALSFQVNRWSLVVALEEKFERPFD